MESTHHGEQMRQLVINSSRNAPRISSAMVSSGRSSVICSAGYICGPSGMFSSTFAYFGEIVVLEGAHRHNVGEVGELVDFDELVDESFGPIRRFGDDGDQRHLPFECAVPTRLTAKSERSLLRMRFVAGPISWSAGSRKATTSTSDSDSSTTSFRRCRATYADGGYRGVSTSTICALSVVRNAADGLTWSPDGMRRWRSACR